MRVLAVVGMVLVMPLVFVNSPAVEAPVNDPITSFAGFYGFGGEGGGEGGSGGEEE